MRDGLRLGVLGCLSLLGGWRSLPAQEPNASADQQHLQLLQLLNAIEPYHPTGELRGQAILAGSNTMLHLGQSWSERFRLFHPQVELEQGVDGSDAGLEALAKDRNMIVGVSRQVTEEDLAKLKSGACKEPVVLIVALDPLAVYVHKDNPLPGLTPAQVRQLFAADDSGKPVVASWKELGVSGALASQPVRIHHRSQVSGTRNFIKQSVLDGASLAEPAATHSSNLEICKAIAADPAGVGMCGFGDRTEGVRAVPLILSEQKVEASEAAFLAGQYPLVRPLSLVFDKSLLKQDQGLREAMVRYILSRDGQAEAIRAGFYPLDPNFIRQEIVQLTGTQIR
jgi:phosphate transport system substrate-binding protein